MGDGMAKRLSYAERQRRVSEGLKLTWASRKEMRRQILAMGDRLVICAELFGRIADKKGWPELAETAERLREACK